MVQFATAIVGDCGDCCIWRAAGVSWCIVSTSPSTERYRLLPLRVQIWGLVLCWTLTIVQMRIPHWMPRVGSVFTGCLAIAFLFFPELRIDFQQGVITESHLFLGLLPVRQRRRTKDEFAGIKCKCYRSSDGHRSSYATDNVTDTWVVELHPRSGRAVAVRQFSGAPGSADCPEARAFARELSALTDLKVIDDDA